MRDLNTEQITNAIREMCMEANYKLASDMEQALIKARENRRITCWAAGTCTAAGKSRNCKKMSRYPFARIRAWLWSFWKLVRMSI